MRCDFCFRRCDIKEGKAGFCGQRTASKGHVSSLNENMLCAVSIDPVEKKPLYHFLPNSMTFSVAKTGCSFDCDFCQNWQIAREWKGVRQVCVLPEDAAAQALSAGCPSISFTYTEPLVWQDYMLETAGKAAAAGLRTIMVSNGAFSSCSAQRVIPEIDAFNIDLKGDEYFYRKYCHGEYGPVIDGIREIVRCGRHLEVTTMVIEDIHTKEMIASLGRVLADAGVRVWHLTRFFHSAGCVTGKLHLKHFLPACMRRQGSPASAMSTGGTAAPRMRQSALYAERFREEGQYVLIAQVLSTEFSPEIQRMR